MQVLFALMLCAEATPAEEVVITQVADIYPKLPPEGAKAWDPAPLVQGIYASPFEFTPVHVYELIDASVRPEIIQAVAARAALFYDPKALPLSTLAANARLGQAKQTVPIDERNFAVLFEFFNDETNDLRAVEARIGPLEARKDTESQSMFERRVRARDEALAKARGPFEGRMEGATFALTLAASVVDREGCKRSVATVDLGAVQFDLFRLGMGTTKAASTAVTLTASPTIELAQFTTDGVRRFEVIGRCATTATKVRMSMSRTWDGKWSGSGAF